MKKSKIRTFFDGIRITYKDLPYLHFPLLSAIILILIAWFIWRENALLWGIFILTTYLILATQFHLYRSTRKDLENHQKKIQAYFSLFSILDFKKSLPYMTGWAATPELALTILEEIRENKPKQIMELGSGISTIIASYCLEQNGKGTIISVEHNEQHAQKIRRELEQHKIEAFALIKYAPLISYELDNKKWQWYDLSQINLSQKIDMLIIDGPPLKTNKNARYPALPLLVDKLSGRCTVIIHDAHRPSERSIIEKWLILFPNFNCEVKDTEKGIAILRR